MDIFIVICALISYAIIGTIISMIVLELDPSDGSYYVFSVLVWPLVMLYVIVAAVIILVAEVFDQVRKYLRRK